ncbi:DNA mismatch repair protein [Neobacillus bataviensis]|uniref:DNA mismatch repair protein n=1 Tax=Neobacillus bataviensis TaxID=220685 RepID=UPI001CBAE768|nr:DNA mismatch repair protein [Neobacillus bataviensis]
MSIEMTKDEIINYGLKIFEEIGANEICRVCINSGNSCCFGCEFIEDQVGCQKRNTACTAWLCGVQRYYFNDIGLLEEWNDFWKQVPGRLYRADRTPEVITVDRLPKSDHFSKNTGKNVVKELEIFIAGGGSIDKLERKLSLDLEFGNLYLK